MEAEYFPVQYLETELQIYSKQIHYSISLAFSNFFSKTTLETDA
jgi:hypothetical protein